MCIRDSFHVEVDHRVRPDISGRLVAGERLPRADLPQRAADKSNCNDDSLCHCWVAAQSAGKRHLPLPQNLYWLRNASTTQNSLKLCQRLFWHGSPWASAEGNRLIQKECRVGGDHSTGNTNVEMLQLCRGLPPGRCRGPKIGQRRFFLISRIQRCFRSLRVQCNRGGKKS